MTQSSNPLLVGRRPTPLKGLQQEVEALAESFIAFPPMQPSASFNISGVKEKVEEVIRAGQKGK